MVYKTKQERVIRMEAPNQAIQEELRIKEEFLQGASVGQTKQRPTATTAAPTIPKPLEKGGLCDA